MPEVMPLPLSITVVCLGASAGGLDSLTQFFSTCRDCAHFAYVVIQHLDPDNPSHLAQILSSATTMTVLEAAEGANIRAGHVYVIPPNRSLHLENGVFHLTPRGERTIRHLPIDTFLRSLANDRGCRSIAIILSGGGSDGTLGVSLIHAAGGITFAQDGSADHSEMPESAIATGDIDFILAPIAIATELTRIAKHSYLKDIKDGSSISPVSNKTTAPDTTADEPDSVNDPDLGDTVDTVPAQRILAHLRTSSGIDFAGYRTTMVLRRMRRRMALHDQTDLNFYAAYVENDAREAQHLVNDLLIGVTSFFRDPEVFTALRTKVLTNLITRKSASDTLRIWIAGCSSGEEVYSLAMEVLDQCTALNKHPVIQIFATDINEAAVAKARAGLYAWNVIADIPTAQLERYFSPQDGSYRVDKAVRDLCVFTRHNLSVDTPFSRIDLISCRNVMIYFGAAMQERVMATFHHALANNGTLMLGSSEGINHASPLFRVLDSKNRLYSKVVTSQGIVSLATLIGGVTPINGVEVPVRGSQRTVAANSAEMRKEADRIVLERFGPAGVLVDGTGNIIQFRGTITPYLAPSQGRASLELLKIIHPSLVHTLGDVLSQARSLEAAVRVRSMWFPANGEAKDVFIEAVPVRIPSADEECFLILLEDLTTNRLVTQQSLEAEISKSAETVKLEIPWLRQELAATKQYLASMIEQHDIASEKMQLSGDELLSANEELRVTNEEIQTSKEEQESANEELATLLEELRRRNHELSELNDDLTNLLEKITTPVMILGADLRIRRLTSTARQMFPGAAEISRPIGELGHSFHGFDLERSVRDVLTSGTAGEHQVCDLKGTWREIRIYPYEVTVAGDRHTQGAVVTVLDIDRLKRSEIAQHEAADFTSSIVETISDPIIVLNHELHVIMANRAFHDTFHLNSGETVSRLFADVCDGEWHIPELLEHLRVLVADGTKIDGFQVGRFFPAIGYRMLTLYARRLEHTRNGKPMVIMSMVDLTDHLRLEVESRRFKFISERSSDCHLLIDQTGRYAYANRSSCSLFARTYEELIALSPSEVASQWPDGVLAEARKNSTQGGIVHITPPLFEAVCKTRHDLRVPMEGTATPFELGDNQYVLLSIRDVSGRKEAEAKLIATGKELMRSNQELDRFAAMASHDLQEPLRMITSYLDLLVLRYAPSLDAKARSYIENANNGATRLSAMVRAILQYAQFERGAVSEPVDSMAAMHNAIKNLHQKIVDSEAEITFDPLPAVMAEEHQLSLVFQNILGNAIKFHAPDRKPLIKIQAQESELCWTFSIADNGIGIEASDVTRVFDLFQRLNGHVYEGSGIGLATSRRIIDHHGGRIWLTSTLGVGSVFYFTLSKVSN